MQKIILIPAFLVLALMAASPSVLVQLMLHSNEIFFGIKNAVFATEEIPETRESTIRFVGDIMLGRHVETLIAEHGAEYPYMRLDSSSSTTWVGNFEAVVPKEHQQTPDFTLALSVDKAVLPALVDAGFTYVGLANNHTMDFGTQGLLETRKHLTSAGITTFGDPEGVVEESTTVIETEEGTVGLVAIHATHVLPEMSELSGAMFDLQNESDIQIAFVHWGVEYKDTHHPKQAELAHALIDSGFDAVIGHHPHVVQDIEVYQGSPIFYSLGNFIFDQYFDDRVMEGLVVELTLHDGEAEYALLPYTTSDMTAAPRLMSQVERELFLADLAERSSVELAESIENARILAKFQTNNLHLTRN